VTKTVESTATQVENTIPGVPVKTPATEAANGIVPGIPGAPGKSRATEATNGAGHGKSRAPEATNGSGHYTAGPESPVGHAIDETVHAVGNLLHPHH
jgi:hypothetical protein